MFKLKIKVKDINKNKKVINEKMRRALMKAMFKMEELSINKAPIDQGFLRQNISLFPQILSNKYFLESKALYSASMEYGTRPYYAPIKPLKEWAKRVLGDEDIGWAIQKKIAKEGIKAHPFMRPAFYEVKNYWLNKFAIDEFK